MLRLHPSTIVLTHEEVNKVLERPCLPPSSSPSASSLPWDHGITFRSRKRPVGDRGSDDLSTRTQGLSLVSQDDDAGYTAGTEGDEDDFYTARSVAEDGSVAANNLDGGPDDARVEAWMSEGGLVREMEQWSIWQDPDQYSDGEDTEYEADAEGFSDEEHIPRHRPRVHLSTRQLDGVGELDEGVMAEMDPVRVNTVTRGLTVLAGLGRNMSPVLQQEHDGGVPIALMDNLRRMASRSSLGDPIDREPTESPTLLLGGATIGRVPHGRFRFMNSDRGSSVRVAGNPGLDDSDDSGLSPRGMAGDTDERKARMQIEAAKRIIR